MALDYDVEFIKRRLRLVVQHDAVVSHPTKRALEVVKREAEVHDFGFTDRTRRLRRSLLLKQRRDQRGRFVHGWQLLTHVPYAVFVEYRQRTRDKRPGPPYWLARAAERARKRMVRRLAYEVRKGIGIAVRKLPPMR